MERGDGPLGPYSFVTKYHLFIEAYYGQKLMTAPLPHGRTIGCGDGCKPSSAVESGVDQILSSCFSHCVCWQGFAFPSQTCDGAFLAAQFLWMGLERHETSLGCMRRLEARR